ncbi:hypothetical protein ACKFKF_34355 [Phormidesmis sp. 146-12]
MSINIQCKKILEGIEDLEKYLQESISKEALDLDSNIETIKNQELLSHLKRSLVQYTERGKNLIYIGFMGHFSAGKSSTINSLLCLTEESEEARKVGLNPVDKAITLITHNENRDVIFGNTREGLVTIRSSFIDKEFLRDIVIADTPGAGDPGLAKEVAKNFLPICDLIVYFLSAAVPLDDADTPLLSEKDSHLAFVPMQIVVTRADEFKLDHDTSFSHNNFDKRRANSFLSELCQRVNQLFKNSSHIDAQSVLLIDNKSQFNIEVLRQTLLDFANVSNIESQISIHDYKVLYFRSSADGLKSFFCSFLLEKLQTLSSIIKTAEDNIKQFQGKIRVTNNTLTETWSSKLVSLREIEQDVQSYLPDVLEMPSSIELTCHSTERAKFLEYVLKQEATRQTELIIKGIWRSLVPQLKEVISDSKRKAEKLSSLENTVSLEQLELKFPRVQKHKLFVNTEFFPSPVLSSQALEIRRNIDDRVIKYHHNLASAIKNFKQLLTEQRPLRDYTSLLNSAVDGLAQDFDAYFDAVKVYTTGVFAYKTKEAISKLGLMHQMDELESAELTDDQKVTIKQEAQEHVFPETSQAFIETFKNFVELQVRAEELQRNIKAMSSDRVSAISGELEEWQDSQVNVIKDELTEQTQSYVNELEQTTNGKIKSLVADTSNSWSSEVSKLRIERRNRFIIIVSSFFAFSLIGYFLWLFGWQQNLSGNIFSQSVFGVVINLASSLIGASYYRKSFRQISYSYRGERK